MIRVCLLFMLSVSLSVNAADDWEKFAKLPIVELLDLISLESAVKANHPVTDSVVEGTIEYCVWVHCVVAK